jgi:hypothetical protein
MHQKRTPFKSLNGFQLLNIQIFEWPGIRIIIN